MERLPAEQPSNLGEQAGFLYLILRHHEGAVQFPSERENVGVALGRLAGEGLHDDCLDTRAEVECGSCLVEGDRWLRQELCEHLARTLGEIWQASGEEEVRDGRQRILVCGWRHEFTGQCFGGNVHERAYEVPSSREALILARVGRCRDSEVEQLGGARLGIVHGVVGFQIPMDNAGIVRGLHGLADAQDNPGHLVSREWCVLLGVALEQFTRSPFDDQIVEVVCHPGLDGANDVGMDDSLAELGFTIESCDSGFLEP